MSDQSGVNTVRFMGYVTGILIAQQEADVRCRVCKSFAGVAKKMRETVVFQIKFPENGSDRSE